MSSLSLATSPDLEAIDMPMSPMSSSAPSSANTTPRDEALSSSSGSSPSLDSSARYICQHSALSPALNAMSSARRWSPRKSAVVTKSRAVKTCLLPTVPVMKRTPRCTPDAVHAVKSV
eukprot:gene11906-13872_t